MQSHTINDAFPIVSVVIPVYNAEKYIKQTIDSVLAQTYDYWEIICVDDGSSDKSLEIIRDYVKKDNRVKLIQRNVPQKGGSVCRNIGANSSKGKYIIFLDSDDCLSPVCLRHRIEVIESTNLDFVVFPVGYFSNDVKSYKMYNKLSAKDPVYCFAAASPAWQTMQALIKKDFYKRIGGFDEKYQRFQDVEFYFRALLEVTGRYLVVNNYKPDCFFRHDGISGNMTPSKLRNSLDSCCYFFDLVSKNSKLLRNKFKLFLAYYAIVLNYKLFSFALKKNQTDMINLFCNNSTYLETIIVLNKFEKIILNMCLFSRYSSVNKLKIKIIRKCIDYILYYS